MREIYSFESKVYASEVDKGEACIIFPYDIGKKFGAGRAKVQATFDNVPYEGSTVNMGVKNPGGSVCYILRPRKDIRKNIGEEIGDIVVVTVERK